MWLKVHVDDLISCHLMGCSKLVINWFVVKLYTSFLAKWYHILQREFIYYVKKLKIMCRIHRKKGYNLYDGIYLFSFSFYKNKNKKCVCLLGDMFVYWSIQKHVICLSLLELRVEVWNQHLLKIHLKLFKLWLR